MKKLAMTLFISSSLFVSFQQAYSADCQPQGTAEISVFDLNSWSPSSAGLGQIRPGFGSYDATEILDYSGDRFFSGPVTPDAILTGPYRDYTGISILDISSYIEFSTNWRPDGREVCVNHKTKPNGARVCVEKGLEYDATSFIVDITQNLNGVLGTPIYQKTFFNVNQINRGYIYLPNLHCKGDLSGLEVRIHSLTNGSVDFTIHNLHLDSRWNYVR